MTGYVEAEQSAYLRRDPFMLLAMVELRKSFGLAANEFAKGKTLRKFGRTTNADAGVKTTVGVFQGSEVNETYASGDTVDSIVSDSASDTGVVEVQGHTFAGGFVVQDATLNGQTPVTLATPLRTATRIKVKDGTIAVPSVDLLGNVYVYDSALATGVTAGVPDVEAATKVMIVAGQSQSAKCASTISAGDVFVVTSVYAAIQRNNTSINADLDVEYRQRGGVWLPMGLEMSLRTASQSSIDMPQRPYPIILPDTDFRMVVTSDTANTSASGHINGVLLSIT